MRIYFGFYLECYFCYWVRYSVIDSMIKKVLLIGSVILFALAVFDVKLGNLALIPGGLLLFASSFLPDASK